MVCACVYEHSWLDTELQAAQRRLLGGSSAASESLGPRFREGCASMPTRSEVEVRAADGRGSEGVGVDDGVCGAEGVDEAVTLVFDDDGGASLGMEVLRAAAEPGVKLDEPISGRVTDVVSDLEPVEDPGAIAARAAPRSLAGATPARRSGAAAAAVGAECIVRAR